MSAQHKNIGLLGGSFDPVHNGHISIAESFLTSNLIDELWILLTPDPPHKTDKPQVDKKLRLKMLRAAFKDFDNIRISDIENELPKPSYTIQTLTYLNNQFPENSFYLCIGGDSLRDFKKWKDWQKILDKADLLVAQRPSADTSNVDEILEKHVHIVEHEPIEISSTKVRNVLAEGGDISGWVPSSVKRIIESEQLYRVKDDE